FRNGLMKPHDKDGIDPSARISPAARIGKHVVIGRDVVIEALAIIEDFVCIGDGTYVGQNAVIGARGMQNTNVNGHSVRVEFAGGVKIGAGCEILALAIVQKPYHCDYTEIGDEAKISVKANVAHGVKIGARTMVGGNAQIAGNAVVGDDVWIGQSATLADGIRIGDRAEVKMGAVVVKNVPAGAAVSGNFAVPHINQVRHFTELYHEK
ncbi:MAG: hypothetical protein QOD99_2976, partial [Chthoniobacter sp.]|nr:hypothetical protein [Chthoniobacter sp.]